MKIEATNLAKRFNREWVFKNLNFTSEEGQTYVILGPNGSGKSTLLQTLTGMIPPSEGQLKYLQQEREISLENVYQHLAICAPYQELIDEYTLSEMIEFHFKFKNCLVPPSEILEQSGLSHAVAKTIGTFSSGMKQRLKVTLALYSEVEFLFLDEPCTNMDSTAIEWYGEQLQKTKAKKTVFIASNQPHEYPGSAQRIDILGYK